MPTAPRYGVLIQIRWGRRSEPPPNGLDVLAEIFRPETDPNSRTTPTEFELLHTLGDGYSVYHSFPALAPRRELPPEKLAQVRKKRAARRIGKKYPLFADQFLAQELETKPDYYSGETRIDLKEAKDAVIKSEAERLAFLTSHMGELLIYGKSPKVIENSG